MIRSKGDEVASQPIPPNRIVVFLVIAALGLTADLWTKSWIFAKLWPPNRPDVPQFIWLWRNHVGLQVSLNEGALFGFGQGMVWLFVALSLLAAVGICYWLFVLGEARSLWLTVALSGIMAGILGNLYDRIGMHGLRWPVNMAGHMKGDPVYAVRDWILLQWNDALRWPNFNIADSLLVCGAVMLFLHTLVPQNKNESHPESDG